jgi:hypothetical protein
MNRHETNKFNMGNSVAAQFNDSPQIISEYRIFQGPVGRLKLTLTDIAEIDKQYQHATGGKTATKTNAEDDLLEDLMPVKSALYALGSSSNNEPLKALTRDSEWELKKMRDTDFLNKAVSIKEEAVKLLTDIAPYKITTEVLTELQGKIDAFKGGLDGQDTGIADRSALRKQLSAKFDELDKIFEEELDQLIELIRKSNKLFYDKYITARGIRDLGGRKKTAEEKPASENTTAQ